MTFALEDLAATIRARLAAGAEDSYTVKLARKGSAKCAEKFGEEAVEAIVAAVAGDHDGLRHEAADVLYHLQVMLAAAGIGWAEVLAELEGREGRSGVAEKAARSR
jgi:phosphoribosyl-ATP pyrophosphohydrolase